MGRIRNTTAEIKESPLLGIMTALPGGIEASEAAGQSEFVNSEQLPVEGSDHPAFAAMGVVMGKPTPGDPIFRDAKLPPGWRKKATDHSMWSHLVDEKGRERAAIFYKAAFYDRSAHMQPTCRFLIANKWYDDANYQGDAKTRRIQHEVRDADKTVLYATEATEVDAKDWQAEGDVTKAQVFACAAWLHERFPKWEDASAHWDDPVPAESKA